MNPGLALSLRTFFVVAALLTSTAEAGAACLSTASSDDDLARMRNAKSTIEAACPCAAFPPSRRGRTDYRSCVDSAIEAVIAEGGFTTGCRASLHQLFVRSTCGRRLEPRAEDPWVPCVGASRGGRPVTCTIRRRSHCPAVACDGFSLCIDAADTDADLRLTSSDSGQCVSRRAAARDVRDLDLVCAPGQPGVVYGTDDDDTIRGTPSGDTICALGGNDTLLGGDGDDILVGGAGNDHLLGERGHDAAFGENGNDVIELGDGNDLGDGGSDDDEIAGGEGRDDLNGGDGDDTVTGGADADTVTGGPGDDVVAGEDGADRVFAGPGDDHADGGSGDDLVDGGAGVDVVDGGPNVDLCVEAETALGCESDESSLPDTDIDTPSANEPPGTVVFVGGVGLPRLVAEIESTGGLAPQQIRVDVNDQWTQSLVGVAVSPVYDISVPDPGSVVSARLTLPFDVAEIDPAFDVNGLRVASYDSESQLWIPLNVPTTVDTATRTVTVPVPHLSLYTVVQHAADGSWDDEAISTMFDTGPVRCLSPDDPGANTGVDVVFAIDTSGSMSSNDPTAQRVVAAKAFLAALGERDRAAVVDFDSDAVTLIGLTSPGLPANRAAIESALQATSNASGGTNISSAVSRIISILTNSPSGRVRIAILLTDGESSYNDGLTTQARDAGIGIFTVALGAGADRDLLERIAEGTNATAFASPDPSRLVDLYEELARDIIDDGTDTDGDTLTDCEERNGLFVPQMLYLKQLDIDSPLEQYPTFVFPSPDLEHSDSDGTPDGHEVARTRFSDRPVTAFAFRRLLDAGRDDYFLLRTGRPDKSDSDNDGLLDPSDGLLRERCEPHPLRSGTSAFDFDSDYDDLSDAVECFNDTNPFEPDRGQYGVPNLLPFTLFTPQIYQHDPKPVVPFIHEDNGNGGFRWLAVNDTPIFYDEDYNCLNDCDALTQYAQDKSNDNGFFDRCGWGGGDCVTDAGQIRDKIREIVEKQGVFDDDGYVRVQYLGVRASGICNSWYADRDLCSMAAMTTAAREVADNRLATELETSTQETLIRRAPRRGFGPAKITATAALLVAASKVYRDTQTDDDHKRQRVEEALRRCTQTEVLEVFPMSGLLHPCEFAPIFLPGQVDAAEAALFDAEAIAQDPTGKRVLVYSPAAVRLPIVAEALRLDGKAAGTPRQWYRQYEPCVSYPSGQECQEYPYFATATSGPPVIRPLGTWIKPINGSDNHTEGTAYGAFTRACPQVQLNAPFIVVPLVVPAPGPTDFLCMQ